MEITPFICYAREDSEYAQRVYRDLRLSGVEPWLDITRIVAGANWPSIVEIAIWRASHIILLLSSRSIAKEGYVQHEIHEALARLKRMPPDPDRNFIIPVRLDKCDVPYAELSKIHRVDMYKDWDTGIQNIIAGLSAYQASTSTGASVELGVDLMTELKEHADVETGSTRFGEALQTRAAVYAEAVRLIANSDIHDDARATATLFDRRETTDDLFLTYLNLVAAKCRHAQNHGGAFEHHALFAFHRDELGQIPEGVKRGLDVRREVFESQGVMSRLHVYHTNEPILDMLLVGNDRAIIAFPESPTSSRLRHGVSAIGLESISSLRKWYDQTVMLKAVPLKDW